MREEVEALEHHSDGLAEFGEVLAEQLVAREDLLARDLHVGPLGNLEQVHAPHQRRLAAAALADDGHDVALVDVEVDVVQDEAPVEGLAEVLDPDDHLGCVG